VNLPYVQRVGVGFHKDKFTYKLMHYEELVKMTGVNTGAVKGQIEIAPKWRLTLTW